MNKSRYITSLKEMHRRNIAFAKLEISFFITTNILAIDFIMDFPKFVLPLLLILCVFLITFAYLCKKLFQKQAKLIICLSQNELEWIYNNSSQKYLISNITGIRIKRTTKGLIREIKLTIQGSKPIFINALEEFEQFIAELVSKVNKNTQIQNYKEPIDFDHPLYYIFFGTLVGIITNVSLRLIINMSQNGIRILQLCIVCFEIITGFFWIFSKPLSGRYGNKNIVADYIIGLLIILAGVFILLSSAV